MLQGLRSSIYRVTDIEEAKAWYETVLGYPPYFDEPFYVGFNVGGYELGFIPADGTYDYTSRGSGIAYWGVPDADIAYRRLIEAGATENEPIDDVGGDIRIGSVLDPFGNVLGVIYNPHFTSDTANFSE